MKKSNILVIAFVGVALFASATFYWTVEGGVARAQAEKSATGQAADRRAIFKVETLSCVSCEERIRSALEKDHGVTGLQVDLAQHTVSVDYAQAKTSEKKIGETITKAGYPAQFQSFGTPSDESTPTRSTTPFKGCGSGCCG